MVRRSHILRQGPVIGALLQTAAFAAGRQSGLVKPRSEPIPGPVVARTVPPRHPTLVTDYVRAVGGDPSWYRGVVPSHLVPQWAMPIWAQLVRGVSYDATKALNGGFSMDVRAPLPAGEALHVRGQLVDVDDDGRRAVLDQQVITGTDSAPDAIETHLYAIVPLKREKGGKKKDKPRVPEDVQEVARFRFTPGTAWEFAVLTGDFNPIHWVPPAARAAGFKNTILHGFATLAFTLEALNRVRFSGDPTRLRSVDVRFTRPLVLPAKPGLFLDGRGGLFVGTSPGGPAFLTGHYTLRSHDA